MDEFRNPNGTYDGLAVMGKVTGLGRTTLTDIWAQVKANLKLLDGCPGHDFVPATDTTSRNRVCRVCGGEADSVHVSWYEKGLKHAGARKDG